MRSKYLFWLHQKRKTLSDIRLYSLNTYQVEWQLKKAGMAFLILIIKDVGGAVASWLVRSTPERAVRVQALAGDIVLCSWARHFTLTVPLSTQVYKWVPGNLMLEGNPAMD